MSGLRCDSMAMQLCLCLSVSLFVIICGWKLELISYQLFCPIQIICEFCDVCCDSIISGILGIPEPEPEIAGTVFSGLSSVILFITRIFQNPNYPTRIIRITRTPRVTWYSDQSRMDRSDGVQVLMATSSRKQPVSGKIRQILTCFVACESRQRRKGTLNSFVFLMIEYFF